MKLEVDLDAFVADAEESRFDLEGNRIRMQPGEVIVSRDSVVDNYGHPVAGHLRTREEAYFVARCINALKGVVPVPGSEEGAEIYRQQIVRAKVRAAEYALERAKEELQ